MKGETTMIKDFVMAWNKNKKKLEEYFRTHKQGEYCDYEDLVKLLFDIIINPERSNGLRAYDTDNILVIDDGDWQGTQIFVLHENRYQPNVEEYVYTNTYYGSCSGCDTLQAISGYSESLPTEQQVKDYMTLCMHLMQKCVFMIDVEEEGEYEK